MQIQITLHGPTLQNNEIIQITVKTKARVPEHTTRTRAACGRRPARIQIRTLNQSPNTTIKRLNLAPTSVAW